MKRRLAVGGLEVRKYLRLSFERLRGLTWRGLADLWAFQRDGIIPDFVVLSKTLGAGLPLGAVVTTSAIAEAARDAGFLWLTTHLNDPATAAIGVKVSLKYLSYL